MNTKDKIIHTKLWINDSIELYLRHYKWWIDWEIRNKGLLEKVYRHNTMLVDNFNNILFLIINKKKSHFTIIKWDFEYKWNKTLQIKYNKDIKNFDIVRQNNTIKVKDFRNNI